MKILDVKITANDKLVITTSERVLNFTRILVDQLTNRKNIYSEILKEHSYNTRNASFNEEGTIVTIDISEWDLDRSSFIVTLQQTFDGVTSSVRKFVFDDEELYYGEVALLNSFCNTCLDKQQKERIVLLSVKEQLLQYAVKNELLEDSIDLYTDLTRLLNIDINNHCFYKGVLISDVDKFNIADIQSAKLRYNKHSQYYLNNRCCCTNGTCNLPNYVKQ